MLKVFVSILIGILAHMFIAVRRTKRVVGQAVPMRDVLVFFVLNALVSACVGTLCWEVLGLIGLL